MAFRNFSRTPARREKISFYIFDVSCTRGIDSSSISKTACIILNSSPVCFLPPRYVFIGKLFAVTIVTLTRLIAVLPTRRIRNTPANGFDTAPQQTPVHELHGSRVSSRFLEETKTNRRAHRCKQPRLAFELVLIYRR